MRKITVQVLPNNSIRAEFSSRLTGRSFSATVNKLNRLHIRRCDDDYHDDGTDKIVVDWTSVPGGMTEQHWVRYPVAVAENDLLETIESFRSAIDRFIFEHEWMHAASLSDAWMAAANAAGARLAMIPRKEKTCGHSHLS